MPIENDKILQIQGVYNTLYHTITQPDRKFAVTRYFLDQWVPLLGPSLAWLVVALRQRCYWNDRSDWCIVDKATLAQETGLQERTIERNLKHAAADWFVINTTRRYRYRRDMGKRVRDKNRYQLLLTEPLTPQHQTGLATLIAQTVESLPAGKTPLDTALKTVEALLEIPHLTDKISGETPLSELPAPRTPWQLLEESLSVMFADYTDRKKLAQLDQACAQLHTAIVQPNKIYVGWQYFRLNWVPLLGHSLAWLVVFLRRHCFWDERNNELRDECTFFKKELAAAINQTSRNLGNLMQNEHVSLFFTTPDEAETAKNKPTCYKVRLIDEPLTPADQDRAQSEILHQLQNQLYEQNPENGQLNFLPVFNIDIAPNRQNFAYGKPAEKKSGSQAKKSRVDADSSEKMSASNGKNVATFKRLSLKDSKTENNNLINRTNPVAADFSLETLLDELEIREPARSRLLDRPRLTTTEVRAWLLYAEAQPGLDNPQAYAIKRLLAADPAPADFVAFAQLDDVLWDDFEALAHRLAFGEPFTSPLAAELEPVFLRWLAHYSNLDPLKVQRHLSEDALIPAAPISSPTTPAETLWGSAKSQLQSQLPRATFDRLLKNTRAVSYRDGSLVVATPSQTALEWLEKRLHRQIERSVLMFADEPVTLSFVVNGQSLGEG